MKLKLNTILVLIIIFLLVFFSLSTVIILAGRAIKPKIATEFTPQEIEKRISQVHEKNLSSFTGIERLRVVTKGEKEGVNGTSIVLTPWFSYTKDDNEFLEELSKKVPKIKSVIRTWFSLYTLSELKKMGENAMKMQLLDQINEVLVLNKIQEIYFSEFIYLD